MLKDIFISLITLYIFKYTAAYSFIYLLVALVTRREIHLCMKYIYLGKEI